MVYRRLACLLSLHDNECIILFTRVNTRRSLVVAKGAARRKRDAVLEVCDLGTAFYIFVRFTNQLGISESTGAPDIIILTITFNLFNFYLICIRK